VFEKAKTLQQLGRLEDAVETTAEVRGILSKLASTSGCLKYASRFVRENDASEFGGAYLVMSLSEMAADTAAPSLLLEALMDLVAEVMKQLGVIASTNYMVYKVPSATACEIFEKLSAAVDEADGKNEVKPEPLSVSPESASAPLFSGNLPDLTQRQASRMFRSDNSLILFLKDVPPVGERLGHNPVGLRFTYVVVVVDDKARRPVFFVCLERSAMGATFLSTIDAKGTHSNLGIHKRLAYGESFVSHALSIVRQELAVAQVEELRRRP
jgi:hypothetical protein